MERLPVAISFKCEKCHSVILFYSPGWTLGKRFQLKCDVCKMEYYVAFTLAPVAEETQIPDTFLRAFDSAGTTTE